MTNVDDEIRRALGMLDAAAPSPPPWSDIDREPAEPARRGAVLLAVAAIFVVVVAAAMLRLGTRDADTDIVDVPSPTARPDDLDGIDDPDGDSDDVETAPGVAPLHPEFERMLADDGQPSTTGSGLDEIPCFQDPPPPSADVAAEPYDHVRDVEVHVNDTCIRSVFVLGTDAESGGRLLARAPEIDPTESTGLVITGDPIAPLGFRNELRFVPGSDLLDLSAGLVGVIGQLLHHPGNVGDIRLWSEPARLVVDASAEALEFGERPTREDFSVPRITAASGGPIRAGQVIRVSTIEPGEGNTTVTLRTAPSAGSDAGSGRLVATNWSTEAVFDVAGGWGVACGVEWAPAWGSDVTRSTSEFRYSTGAGPQFRRFVLGGLAPGDYELAFQHSTGDVVTHVTFTVETCRHLVIGPDGAHVVEIRNGGAPRVVSETIRIGDPANDAVTVLREAFDATPTGHPLSGCPTRSQYVYAGDAAADLWGPSAIQVEGGRVAAIAGTTVEGIGGGSTREPVREALDFDMTQLESRRVRFLVGPYSGRALVTVAAGEVAVQEMWIGEPAWTDGQECFFDW